MTTGTTTLRLPARFDTLAALRLASTLRAALTAKQKVALDASDMHMVGIVALQLLAAARIEAGRHDAELEITGVSDAMAARIDDAGLAGALLDAPGETIPTGRRLRVRFTDSALRFGGEPLDRLVALRALGITIRAVLPAERARDIMVDPDRLLTAFHAWIAAPVDRDAVEAALATADGTCIVEWETVEKAADAPPSPAHQALPLAAHQAALVPITQDKLDTIVSLVGDLIVGHATLVERMDGQRVALATEIADLDRTIAALQEGIVKIATSPLAMLLPALAGASGVTLAGGETEIDRGLFDRIAPGLAALFATNGSDAVALTASEDGGFLILGITLPAPSGAADTLRDLVHSFGGQVGTADGGRSIELRLPRSLTLLDAIILNIGQATYAVPVSHMIEGLRPTGAMLHRFDRDRTMLRYREHYIPVVAIGRHLGLNDWERDPLEGVLVVVQAGGAVIALQADAISDQRQIALKPLGGGLAPPAGIAGAAITGANRITLVLDLVAFEPAAA